MQKSVKVRLQFNTTDTEKPFVHLFATKFGLVFSILQADIMPGRGGRMIMDLTGEAEDIERALAYAAERNVRVKILSKAIVWNDASCVHCGACTAVCLHKALTLDPVTAELSFNNESCVVCEMCVKACPTGAVRVDIYNGNES